MKNKKKVLIAVAAMALVAVGTAGVGTAAWYQTAASASISANPTPTTGTITSTYTDSATGNFVVTPLLTGPATAVELTDASNGKSYVFDKSVTAENVATQGATHKIAVTPTKPTASITACGYKIVYSGSATTVAGVQAEWNSVTNHALTFTLDGSGGNADLIRFGAEADANNVVTGANYSWTKISSVTFGDAILGGSGQTFALDPATILVSLTGSDTVIQTSLDVYTVNMTVSITE